MSSDEVYHVKALYWRQAEATTYMDIPDAKWKVQNQMISTKSGSEPAKRIRSEDPKVSDWKAVQGLPVELYDHNWFDGLKSEERKMLQANPGHFKWVAVMTKNTWDGCEWSDGTCTFKHFDPLTHFSCRFILTPWWPCMLSIWITNFCCLVCCNPLIIY